MRRECFFAPWAICHESARARGKPPVRSRGACSGLEIRVDRMPVNQVASMESNLKCHR